MNLFNQIMFGIFAAKEIISKGDEGLLSREAIPEIELSRITDKIHIRRQTDGPVFARGDCFRYYEMKLAHSWAEPEKFKVFTLLQIPIASLKDIQSLHILDRQNKLELDLPMAVLNKQRNSYRHLSATDLAKCMFSCGGSVG